MTPKEPRHSPTHQALEHLALFGLLAMIALYVSRTIWDIDVFWHIAAGRAFWSATAIPTTDIFSAIDPDRTWVTFQWGYEMLVFGLDALGGLGLVRRVHGLVMLASFLLFFWGCRKRLQMGPWASLILTALLLVLFQDRIRVRPHVFNLLAWSILFPWLIRGPKALGRRATWVTVTVVALWANIHAGGAFLFLVASATLPAGLLLTRLAGQQTPHLRWTLIWYGAALLAALAAPQFVRGNIQALTMLEASESAIGEWLPAWHFLDFAIKSAESHCSQTNGSFLFGCLWGSPSAAAHILCGSLPSLLALAWFIIAFKELANVSWNVRRWLRDVCYWQHGLILALLVLSHRSVRFVYIAVFAGLCIQQLHGRFLTEHISTRMRHFLLSATLAMLLVVAYRFNITAQHSDLATAVERAVASESIDARRFPTAQADFLRRTGFEGRIFCQGNWGGYLLWRLWPDALVTADGRGNYARSVTEDLAYIYDRSHFRTPIKGRHIQGIYEKYPIDAVVHQHPVWPEGFQPDADVWVPVQRDPKGAIWIRRSPQGNAYLAHLREMIEASRSD